LEGYFAAGRGEKRKRGGGEETEGKAGKGKDGVRADDVVGD